MGSHWSPSWQLQVFLNLNLKTQKRTSALIVTEGGPLRLINIHTALYIHLDEPPWVLLQRSRHPKLPDGEKCKMLSALMD